MLHLRIKQCCTAPGWTITNSNRPGNLSKFLHVSAFCWHGFCHTSTSAEQLPNIHILKPASSFSLLWELCKLHRLSNKQHSDCQHFWLFLSHSPPLALSCLSRFSVCSASFYTTCFFCVQLQSSYSWAYVIPIFEVMSSTVCSFGHHSPASQVKPLCPADGQILESPRPTLAHSNFPKCPRTHCRIQWQLEEGGPFVSRIERMHALAYLLNVFTFFHSIYEWGQRAGLITAEKQQHVLSMHLIRSLKIA